MHTPIPWIADTQNRWPEQSGCCPLVGRPYSISHNHRNVAAANTADDARLIAAAPELLALAYQYANDMRYPPAADSRQRRLMAIEAAITKATGED